MVTATGMHFVLAKSAAIGRDGGATIAIKASAGTSLAAAGKIALATPPK
jgi:hypothetical protein